MKKLSTQTKANLEETIDNIVYSCINSPFDREFIFKTFGQEISDLYIDYIAPRLEEMSGGEIATVLNEKLEETKLAECVWEDSCLDDIRDELVTLSSEVRNEV